MVSRLRVTFFRLFFPFVFPARMAYLSIGALDGRRTGLLLAPVSALRTRWLPGRFALAVWCAGAVDSPTDGIDGGTDAEEQPWRRRWNI